MKIEFSTYSGIKKINQIKLSSSQQLGWKTRTLITVQSKMALKVCGKKIKLMGEGREIFLKETRRN